MPFKRQKSNVSPHYHDTRTLLRKYRDVMWNLEVSDLDLQEEFKAEYGLSTDALFVDSEVNKGGNRLESYARALERSKKMMQIIDTAIDLINISTWRAGLQYGYVQAVLSCRIVHVRDFYLDSHWAGAAKPCVAALPLLWRRV